MNTNKYFHELALNLQRAGFTVGLEADGLLPVELDGKCLCVATESGSIRYRKEAVSGEDRSAALDKVIDIAGVTAEYMKQMEAAPFLKASGLDEKFKLLADFNRAVLAGQIERTVPDLAQRVEQSNQKELELEPPDTGGMTFC